MTATRPLWWSMRREVWENRSIYLGPLVVAGTYLLGFAISTIGLAERRRAVLLLSAAAQRQKIGAPYDSAAMVLIMTGFIIAIFYCLDALHGERRDRSILFWKSLPVSDRSVVLAKMGIPMIVVPVLIFTTVVALQLTMMLHTSIVLLFSGMSPASTWMGFNLIGNALILMYGLTAMTLWHAPIFGWLLLVSAWARRAPVLWALLPVISIAAVEQIALGTMTFLTFLYERWTGSFTAAFVVEPGPENVPPILRISDMDPVKFVTEPGLWAGLLFAAACVVAAIRLRRYRDPV